MLKIEICRNQSWRWIFSILLCFGLLGAVGFPEMACATTIAELSDAEHVAYSDYILHGKITAIQPEITENGLSVTRVTLQVYEWYKAPETWSELPETMAFYVRGGVQGTFVQTILGEFKPHLEDELVVFLEQIPRYQMRPMLVGLAYGAFLIDNSPVTRADGHRLLKHRTERQEIAVHRRQGMTPDKVQIQSATHLAALKNIILHHVQLEKKAHRDGVEQGE